MRRFAAFALALLLAFSLPAFLLTAQADTTDYRSEEKTADVVIKKLYKLNGAADTALYPAETLTFSSTPGTNNPDQNANLTVDPLEVKGNANQVLTIHLPVYSQVGTYQYTIREAVDKKMQGVTYTDAQIDVTVLVTYNYEAKKLDTKIVLSTVNSAGGKVDTFENQYGLGALTLQKEVTGNLGDQDAYFDIRVSFAAEKQVASDIAVRGGSHEDNLHVLKKESWKAADGRYTCTQVFKLRHGETLTFENVPQGISYAVEEDSRHGLQGSTLDPNSAGDTDYSVSYTNETGTVETAKTTAIMVTNHKNTDVPTGVELDAVPYILMLAAAGLGGMLLLGRKRYDP